MVQCSTKLKKKLPDKWGTNDCKIKTIYIREYFKVDGAYTDDLRLKYDPKRGSLQAEWSIPKLSTDIRSKTRRESTGTWDPQLAAAVAVEKQSLYNDSSNGKKRVSQVSKKYSLERYWKIWFEDFCKDNALKRNGRNNITNQKSYWVGKDWGIGSQPFSKKNIEDIDYNDLNDYWRVLDVRGASLDKPRDMAGQKKQIKTVLNKLVKTARVTDKGRYGNLPDLVFPTIKQSLGKDEVEVFTRKEWDKLLETVIGLSGGIANAHITNEHYMSLDNGSPRIEQPRHWVDLYDALILLYFFHLRAEDIPRLESEWIHEDTDEGLYLYLEIVKGDRLIRHKSTSYRSGSDNALERIKKRKPTGFLLFTDNYLTGREDKNFAFSQVGETLNICLQHAVKVSGIKKRGNMTLTNVRHTAFYLLIKEFPDHFKTVEQLTMLGNTGFSSEKMLRETYVNKIYAEEHTSKVRKLGTPNKLELIIRSES